MSIGSIIVELASIFLGPNEVSMMYAVGFMPEISERYAFESYAPKKCRYLPYWVGKVV